MTKELELAALRGGRRWTMSDGRAVVRALRASGSTLAAFARAHGLRVERLRRWRIRVGLDTGPVATSLVPVEVIANGALAKFEIVIGDIVVRVPATFDEGALRRLLGIVA
jgi:transposase-like protein